MKVATKLAGGFSLLIIILAALMINHLALINRAVSANRNLSAIAQRLTLSMADQTRHLDQLDEAFRKYIYSQDERYVQVAEEAVDGFERTLDQLESSRLTEAERVGLDGLARSWAAVAAVVADPAAVSEPPLASSSATEDAQAARSASKRSRSAARAFRSCSICFSSKDLYPLGLG